MKDTVSGCPIEDVMRLLSGRWPTLLIYYLSNGPKRFSELRRDNPKISQRMLTLELRELEAAGIVSRTIYPGVPARVDYELTADGRELVPLLNALGDWWGALRQRHRTAAAQPHQEGAGDGAPIPYRAALATPPGTAE
ncbi:helix-turn-helix transcriptional regulator [Archangium minus]|uniref:Helix-turn-helix transcriptional regulator n=1 Tax=Archangium minus TaxID=83450 RepID=A0ABY9WUR7_9BACT|nr:helix-turn-helix transcriptional regulator [Archangium minus]